MTTASIVRYHGDVTAKTFCFAFVSTSCSAFNSSMAIDNIYDHTTAEKSYMGHMSVAMDRRPFAYHIVIIAYFRHKRLLTTNSTPTIFNRMDSMRRRARGRCNAQLVKYMMQII